MMVLWETEGMAHAVFHIGIPRGADEAAVVIINHISPIVDYFSISERYDASPDPICYDALIKGAT